jgi:iron complex outermembrane recepter protein
MRLQIKRPLAGGIALTVAIGWSGLDYAQTAQTAQTPADNGTLAEVVVTAQKRTEDLQKTPVSVTAVTEDDLVRQGIYDFATLGKVAPDLSAITNQGAYTAITIRGVQPQDWGPTSETPNAVYLNGAFISRDAAFGGLFYDVQRVEVLSGPQGTLYGRNSTGGAINIITATPTQTYGGYGTVDFGNYSSKRFEGALNIPLDDSLAVRAAFWQIGHDGYYTDTGLDDLNRASGRISLLWKPVGGNQQLLITGDTSNENDKGGGSTFIGQGTPPYPGIIIPANPRDDSAVQGDAALAQNHIKSWGLMGQYDYDFQWATLSAQASYRELHYNAASGSTTDGFYETTYAQPDRTYNSSDSDWNSQEIRLTSDQAMPLQWVVGLFRFGEHITNNQSSAFSSIAVPSGPPFFAPPVSPGQETQDIATPLQDGDSYAVFGQTTYSPIDSLHFTGGLRYSYDAKSSFGSTQLGASPTGPVVCPANSNVVIGNTICWSGDDNWKRTTGKLNVSYDLTSTSMLYGGYSTGYKAGGFAYGPTPEYKPETIKAYEVGSKNRFFADTLQVNLSAWYYDYRDFETTVVASPPEAPNVTTITVVNAGSALMKGASANVDWLPTDNDRFHGGVTWLHAYFGSFNLTGEPNIAPFAAIDYSHTEMGNAPPWSANVSYDHTLATSIGRWDAQVAAQYYGNRVSGTAAVPGTLAYQTTGAFTTIDFSLRYQPNDKGWNVTAYVRNAADKDVYTSVGTGPSFGGPPGAPYVRTATLAAPRTLGVTISVPF